MSRHLLLAMTRGPSLPGASTIAQTFSLLLPTI
jgi:hypothetical protein